MVHTLDIEKIKSVTDKCEYYDYITDYDIEYDDEFTFEFINWYRDVIFLYDIKDNRELDTMKWIDKSVYLYLTDNIYKREFMKKFNTFTFNMKFRKEMVNKIIFFSREYQDKFYLYLFSSRWI